MIKGRTYQHIAGGLDNLRNHPVDQIQTFINADLDLLDHAIKVVRQVVQPGDVVLGILL